MMNEFLLKLSQNLIESLDEDDEYFDITIEVGNDPQTELFRAHMFILYRRSLYFRKILTNIKRKDDETLSHIKLPNIILPDIFQIVLRYVYGGKISLEALDPMDTFNILVAASILELQELIPYIQSFLIENKSNWLIQNFSSIYKPTFENKSFSELQKFITGYISSEPDKILESLDYSSSPESLLISLIQSEKLDMNESQVWDHVIKWGIAQNSNFPSDLTKYSDDDFNVLENTLKQCIPLVRFQLLSSREFLHNVLPYKKVFPKEFYMNLLEEFLDNDFRPGQNLEFHDAKETIYPKNIEPIVKDSTNTDINDQKSNNLNVKNAKVRVSIKPEIDNTYNTESINSEIIEIGSNNSEIYTSSMELAENRKNFDSVIISIRHVELISKWINGLDFTDEQTSLFDFRLLYRGSRDGLTPKIFHNICDNKIRTVSFVKVEGSNEILGGYNPTSWKSEGGWNAAKDSFIFSFESKENIDNYIFSRVINEKKAINNGSSHGPSFGNEDLNIYRKYLSRELSVYCNNGNYGKNSYEKPIRKTPGYVGVVEELEVFQVVLY